VAFFLFHTNLQAFTLNSVLILQNKNNQKYLEQITEILGQSQKQFPVA